MDIPLSAFRDRLLKRARRERRPLSCLFEVTPACNLRCQFCYVALDPYRGPYLSTEQAKRVIDIIADAGVLWLTLTGGEVLSRRDFETLYRHAAGRGLLVTIFTNATMVKDEHVRLFSEVPPFEVEVSIYGADAEHYEATTQIPGSYGRFERGVGRLLEAGVRLKMKCPLSTFTQDHLPALHAWCRERGLPLKLDRSIDARHDGGHQPYVYRIEPRRMKQMVDQAFELKHGRRREAPMPECAVTDESSANELYYCGAGRTSFFVDAMGRTSHCVIDREPSFPILEMPWAELWARMGGWVTQPLPADAACSGCSMRGGCDNCPARARLATGSPYGRDPYQCDLTHVEFGVQPGESDIRRGRTSKRPLGACAR